MLQSKPVPVPGLATLLFMNWADRHFLVELVQFLSANRRYLLFLADRLGFPSPEKFLGAMRKLRDQKKFSPEQKHLIDSIRANLSNIARQQQAPQA